MISVLLLVLAFCTLIAFLVNAVDVVRGSRTLTFLRNEPTLAAPAVPRLSVVIAARNEEHGIEDALRSVLRQDHPALEVIVVDDRSADATGAILDRMTDEHSELRVIHLRELPADWLGKNHALQRGADAATGEILLFTDADVVMDPTTISRAVAYLERGGWDHVAATPELVMPNAALDLFGGVFAVFFALAAKPWRAREPRSKRHIGIGAFNLVRTEAYRAVGGHRRIRMRPDDDLKLGKIIKQAGFRQDVVFGRGLISVEWYRSISEAVRGLEKNAFAGAGYSLMNIAVTTGAMLVFSVWPFVAVFVTDGWTRALNGSLALLIVAIYAASTRASGSRAWYGLAFPLATLLLVYTIWRSALIALANGGIDWRGTHYPLDALRANEV